ncbi:MAG: lytic transglycosylase domain-containing protein [Candidatus Eremiobacteraeota bacterium]|nr:lytic transglycosylase domain-containing protein [Candidatus Eremiobacteraeota bacterium]
MPLRKTITAFRHGGCVRRLLCWTERPRLAPSASNRRGPTLRGSSSEPARSKPFCAKTTGRKRPRRPWPPCRNLPIPWESPMDINNDLQAVARRIAEITGAGAQTPVAPAAASSGAGVDDMPVLDPSRLGATPFASLVREALAGQSASRGTVDADGIPISQTSPGAPAPVAPEEIDRLVSANSAAWNVDPSLIKAIIANESGFNANATSDAGAQGLMQLMPGTAQGLGVTDSYDPAQNVWGGTRYIKGLLDRFGGNMQLAVAAYNAGPNAVERYNGVPPYAETQNYVQNVLSSYEKYKSQVPQ